MVLFLLYLLLPIYSLHFTLLLFLVEFKVTCKGITWISQHVVWSILHNRLKLYWQTENIIRFIHWISDGGPRSQPVWCISSRGTIAYWFHLCKEPQRKQLVLVLISLTLNFFCWLWLSFRSIFLWYHDIYSQVGIAMSKVNQRKTYLRQARLHWDSQLSLKEMSSNSGYQLNTNCYNSYNTLRPGNSGCLQWAASKWGKNNEGSKEQLPFSSPSLTQYLIFCNSNFQNLADVEKLQQIVHGKKNENICNTCNYLVILLRYSKSKYSPQYCKIIVC